MYCTAVIVVHRSNPVTGDAEFLVMDYQTTLAQPEGILSQKEVRLPAGTNRTNFDEILSEADVRKLAVRKLFEKTGLKALEITPLEPQGFGGIKFGYLVDIQDCSGELRTLELSTYEFAPMFKKDVLSVPFWRQAEGLCGGGLARPHEAIVSAALAAGTKKKTEEAEVAA